MEGELMKKRILSFILAFVMVLSLLPTNLVQAQEVPTTNGKQEATYLGNGTYKAKISSEAYKKKTITYGLMSLMNSRNHNYINMASTNSTINPTDNPKEFKEVDVTIGFDKQLLKALGVESVTLEIINDYNDYGVDFTSGPITLTLNGDYQINKTFKYKVPDPDKYGPSYVEVTMPGPDYREIHLMVETQVIDSSTGTGGILLTASFVGHTGVSVKWNGKMDTRPKDIKPIFYAVNDIETSFDLPIISEDLILRGDVDDYLWAGHPNVRYIRLIPDDWLLCNTDKTAQGITVKINDKHKGQLGTSNYYYEIGACTNDKGITVGAYVGHEINLREKVPVKFDANGGTWKTVAPAEQHSFVGIKLADTFAEQAAVTIPDGATALTPPSVEGKENKFIGWNTDKNATMGLDMSKYEVTEGDNVFYAIYSDKGDGYVNVKYTDLENNPIDSKYQLSEDKLPDLPNPLPPRTPQDITKTGYYYAASKNGVTGGAVDKNNFKKEDAPKFIGYEISRVDIDKDATYTKDGKYNVIYRYSKLPDVVNGHDEGGKVVPKPEGYVTVKFEPGTNGKLTGETTFYVNPKANKTNADITEPKITAKTGFKVADQKWKPDFVAATEIKADATYTAQYTTVKDVVPGTDPETKKPNDKPVGYKTVTFDLDGKGTTENETVFYVNPKKEVTLTAPTVTGKDGYTVKTGKDAWKPKFVAPATYKEDKTFVAQYTFEQSVVPQGPGEEKPVVPNNYVKVEFKRGDHGVISSEETTIYWVDPSKEVTVTAPKVIADKNYKHIGWDKALTAKFDKATDITALYKKIVVPGPDQPKKPDPNNPNGPQITDPDYVKVEFLPGEHGTFEKVGQLEQTTIFWVLNGEKATFNPPTVTEKENYKFTGWDKEVKNSFTANETYTATYKEKVKTTEPSQDDKKDYAVVEFKAGENGKFEQVDVVGQGGQTQKKDQTTKFWVLKNEKVTFNPPQVTANEGYSFIGWKEPVKETYSENTIHTAQYSNSISDKKIQGWTELTFNQGDHGKLANGAKNVKWVDPKVALKLSDIAPGIVADTNYSFKTWTKPGEGTNAAPVEVALESVAKYDKPITFTATYKANVIDDEKDIPGNEKDNFVKVIFDKGDHGKFVSGDGKAITSEISTNVRKNTEVDLTEKAPKVMPDSGYGHTGWKIDQEAINLAKVKVDKPTTITATYIKGEFDEKNINDILVLGPKRAAYAEGDTLDLTGLTILAIDKKGIRKEYTVSQDNKLKATDGKELTGASLSVGETTIDLANLPKLTHKAHNDKPITLTKGNITRPSKVHLTVSMTKTPQPTDLVAANQGENPTKTNIKGKAQKGDTVKIYAPGQKDPIATVEVTNDDGTFETSVSKENKPYDVGTKFNVTATAVDKDESSPQEVKVIKDVNGDWKNDDDANQKTATPTAKAFNVGKDPKVTTITGKDEAGAKVVAKVGETIVGTVTADNNGDYKIEATKTGKTDGGALDKDTEVKVTAQVDKKLVSDPTATVVKIDKDGNGVDDDKEKFDIKKATKIEIIKNPDKMDYLVNKPDGKAKFETKGLVVKFTDDSGKSATYNAEELANMNDVTIKPANNEEIGLTPEGKTNKMDLTVTVTGAEATDKPTAKANRQVIVKLDADGNKIADEDEQTPEPKVTARNIGTDGPDGKKVPATKTTVEIETVPKAKVTIEYTDKDGQPQKIENLTAGEDGKLTQEITPKLKEGTDVKVTVQEGEKKPTDKTVKVFEDLDDNKIPDTQAGQTERPAAIASNKGKTPTFTTIVGKTESGAEITVTLKDGTKVKVDKFTIDTDGNYTLQATVGGKPLDNGTEILVYAENAPKKISNPQNTTVFNDFNNDGKPDGGKVDLTDVKEIQVIAPKKMSYTQGEKLDGTGLKAVITDNKGGIEIFDYDNETGKFKNADKEVVEDIKATVANRPIKDLELTEKDHNGEAIDVKAGKMTGSTNQKLEVKQLQTPTPSIVFAANQNTVGSDGTTPTQTPKDTTTVKFTVVNKPTTVYVKYTDNGVAKEESFNIGANDNKTKTVDLQVKLPVGAEVQVLAKDADKSLSKPATANVVRDADNNGKADNKTPLEKAKIDDIKAGADKILVTPPKVATELVISETDKNGDAPQGSTPLTVKKDGSTWKTSDGKAVTVESGKLVIPKGTFKLDEYNVVKVEAKGDLDTTTPSEATKTVGEAADTTAPAKPIVDQPIAGDTDVKVKTPAEQDAKTITVEIKKTGEAPKTIVVTKGDDGKWKTPDGKEVTEENGKLPVPVTPKLDTGDTVTVITKDDSGNPSEANKQTVAERQQLPAPTINPIKTGEKTVAGKAEKAVTVDIYKKNAQGGFDLIAKDVGVGPDGSYTFNNPDGFKDNDVIKVVSKKPGMIDNSATTTVGVDTSGLDKAIQDGKDALDPEKGGKNNGTPEDKALEDVIKKGEDLKKKDPSPTQEEVDKAQKDIEKAIDDKKKADEARDKLQEKINEANDKKNDPEYPNKPDDVKKELDQSAKDGQKVHDDKNKSKEDIDKAIEKIQEKIDQYNKQQIGVKISKVVSTGKTIEVVVTASNAKVEVFEVDFDYNTLEDVLKPLGEATSITRLLVVNLNETLPTGTNLFIRVTHPDYLSYEDNITVE